MPLGHARLPRAALSNREFIILCACQLTAVALTEWRDIIWADRLHPPNKLFKEKHYYDG